MREPFVSQIPGDHAEVTRPLGNDNGLFGWVLERNGLVQGESYLLVGVGFLQRNELVHHPLNQDISTQIQHDRDEHGPASSLMLHPHSSLRQKSSTSPRVWPQE